MQPKSAFKARMRAYRRAVSSAAWQSIEIYTEALESDTVAEQCRKPTHLPVVSRPVLRHLFEKGGLDAVCHIDSVRIRYN